MEKPFGTSLETARALNESLLQVFCEQEIYRIDHFLGKETVQNILVLRFANEIFESLWNRNYVDYVEIYALESLGIEKRGKYYEGTGALRDMIQNHLMQLLAFVAMESPASYPGRNGEGVEVASTMDGRGYSPQCYPGSIRGRRVEGRSSSGVLGGKGRGAEFRHGDLRGVESLY